MADRPRLVKAGLEDMRWRFCISRFRPLSFGGWSWGIWPADEAGLAGETSSAGESGDGLTSPGYVAAIEGMKMKIEAANSGQRDQILLGDWVMVDIRQRKTR